MTETRVLRLVDATPETAAPFGMLIATDERVPPLRSRFYGDAVEIRKPAKLVNDAQLELSVARLKCRPLVATWLERHPKHTQAFIPLGAKPFVMILAPPGDAALPDAARVTALRFSGAQGIALHLGTWHEFPLALDDDTEIVVLLRHETARDLQTGHGNEADGPDLEKRDLATRLGVTFRVDF
ncbi:MAG: ureidoglycolate hydrolase [Alphaproteobacteria bacterium]|nr:ureidoglycolate hydrolase [Alphaproteobacteria bacterium]